MNFVYDAETDQMYIELLPGPSVESEEIAEGFVVDFDAEGRVVGLDIEWASKKIDMSKMDLTIHPLPQSKVA